MKFHSMMAGSIQWIYTVVLIMVICGNGKKKVKNLSLCFIKAINVTPIKMIKAKVIVTMILIGVNTISLNFLFFFF